MARIPQFVSKENLTKETGAKYRSQDNIGVMGNTNDIESGMNIAQQSAKQITAIGEKMIEIDNANSESRAKIYTTSQQLAYSEKVARSTDSSTAMKDYDAWSKQTGELAAKEFHNPAAKQQFMQDWDLKQVIFKNQMEGVVYKKQVEERKVLIDRDLELQKSAYRNAADETARQSAMDEMEKIVNSPANTEIYDPKERREKVDKSIKDAQDDLKDVESLKRVKEKELKIANDAAINGREKEYVAMKINGKDAAGTLITREELIIQAKNDMNANRISAAFAERYISALKSPKAINAKTIDTDFADMLADIVNGVKPPERIRKEINGITEKGYLSEEDEASAYAFLDMVSGKSPDDLVTKSIKTSWFGLHKFSEANVEEEKASRGRMSRSYIKKLQSGIAPQIASLEAQREEVLFLRPEAMSHPEGMEFMDSSGRMKKIMPNGDLVAIESKPKQKSK
jgi:hypothetical protein